MNSRYEKPFFIILGISLILILLYTLNTVVKLSSDSWGTIIFIVSLISGCFVVFAKDIGEANSKFIWLNSLWFRIPLAVIIVVVPYISNKKIETLKRAETNMNERLKDSANEHKARLLDSAHRKEIKDYGLAEQAQLSETMAKYGLKYDSATKEMRKLVSDSSRSLPDPELSLCVGDGITLDTADRKNSKLTLKLCCRIAPASNIHINIYLAGQRKDINYMIGTSNKPVVEYPVGNEIGTGASSEFSVHLNTNDFDYIYALIVGTYTNHTGSRTFTLNSIYIYTIYNKNFGQPNSELHLKMADYFKKNIK